MRRHNMQIEELIDYLLDNTTESGDCLILNNTAMRKGYNVIYHKGKIRQVHRLVFEYFKGRKLSSDYHAHHICENRACINPDHVEAVLKGEHISNHRRKLRPKIIKGIIDMYDAGSSTMRDVAERYNVSVSTVFYYTSCGNYNPAQFA